MADIPVSQEEQALRRRARRRLVGAIALALLAVVVLPMLFDPEPKPLGGNVEIHIPGPDTPFEPAPPGLAPAAEALPGKTDPVPVAEASPPELPPPAPIAKPASVKPVAPAKPAAVKPAPAPKPAEAKPAEIKSPEAKPPLEPKPEKPSPAPVADGVYLQLGVFSSTNNARQLADKVKAAGFQASVVNSGAKFRVRLGPYDERAQALAAQARLKAKGISSVLAGP